ncbi:MAG: efflux RND transporter periplasmic adaptor subunit [Phycisphaeraceae bacterium]|nr:efflux RND transporter periplasmic adaptor subunit [Phycisphaeraceae bacterium]
MAKVENWLSAIGTRLAILVAFSLLLLVIGLLAWWRGQPPPVEAIAGEEYELPVVVSLPLNRVAHQPIERFYGILEPEAELEMRFSLPGRIHRYGTVHVERQNPDSAHGQTELVEQPLRESARVRKGQTLAWLEPQRYEVAVRSAQVRVEQAQANKAEAQAVTEERRAAVLSARVQLAEAESNRDQQRRLHERNVITQAELDRHERAWEQAEAMYQAAQALHRAAESRRDAANHQLHLAREALEEARIQTEDATLVAPWDGVIAALPYQVGQNVSPRETVIRMVSMDRVKLVLQVPQSRIAAFGDSIGGEVEVRISALESRAARNPRYSRDARPRMGRVAMVQPAADPVTRLFRVEIELDNTDGSLAPGMMAQAHLPGDTVQAVRLPLEAVRYRDQQAWAYFIQRGARIGLPLGAIGADRDLVLEDIDLARAVNLDRPIEENDAVLVTHLPRNMQGVVAGHPRDLTDGRPVRTIELPELTGQAMTGYMPDAMMEKDDLGAGGHSDGEPGSAGDGASPGGGITSGGGGGGER